MGSKFTTVNIKVQPVVKAYLEKNFGNPVTIPTEHILYKLACSQLSKHNIRSNVTINYSHAIDLSINHKNFVFDGFEITPANSQIFNNAVDDYIKNLYRTNIDSTIMAQDKVINYKEKYFELLKEIETLVPKSIVNSRFKSFKKMLQENESSIQAAIEYVVFFVLKLDFSVMSYETIKKDYYRYRKRKELITQTSPTIK